MRRLDHELTERSDLTRQAEPTILRMQFVNANAEPQVVGLEELPGKVNYFLGNDPARWRTNIPTYAKVQYKNIYPGIDLIFYDNQGQLEYDFVVTPGADPSTIRLAFQDQGGQALDLRTDTQGDLVLHTASREILLHKPRIYQEVDGAKLDVSGEYVLLNVPLLEGRDGGQGESQPQVGIHVATYDASRPLIVDPVLSYSTYLGGNDFDDGSGIAVDASGNAYITGTTTSPNFPTTGPLQPTKGGGARDAFVTKLSADGSARLYSTYLGGSSEDYGYSITMDTAGNAYVTGETWSSDFPTANAIQPTNGGGSNAFVTKLNATGSALLYSTYLGGNYWDIGHAIALDTAGNAYVTGETWSDDFPTANPLQAARSGSYSDAFVTKLSAAGSALLYSTYLGGKNGDWGYGIAVDTEGNAYVTGTPWSTDFPTANPFQAENAGAYDAFVTKLNVVGAALVYSTYLGGMYYDVGYGIAVDAEGNAYVTGEAASSDFPRATPFQDAFGGGFNDAFVTKLNAAGSALIYSTYLGGVGNDAGYSIALDASGNAYVTGGTVSANFPTANPLPPAEGGGIPDAFVTKFNTAGSALLYSTYLGGSGSEYSASIAVDTAGNAYITGETWSTNFPIASPVQAVFGGGFNDAFVAKIGDAAVPPVRRVVIIDVDGLRADVAQEALDPQVIQSYPGLNALFGLKDGKPRSRVYTNALTILPSVTLAGHASIFTGTYPGKHGIVGNAWFDRTFNADGKVPNPYPCMQNHNLEFDPERDDGIINYLCPDQPPESFSARASICVVSPLSASLLDDVCRQPVEGLANAHMRVPTLYERLREAGVSSAVNFNHYWRGSALHMAPDIYEFSLYICAYLGNPWYLDNPWGVDCPENPGTKSDFASYDIAGLSRLTAFVQQGAPHRLFTFYFAGIDGYCHHMYEEKARGEPLDVKTCQDEYLKQLLDAQLFGIADVLRAADPSWQDRTMVVLTADHGMTTAETPSPDIKDIKARVTHVLEDIYCVGDCDGNPRDRDIVFADNGGMAHIYVRNQQTKNWNDVPQWNDIHQVARALAEDEQFRKIALIFVRNVESGKEWDSEYKLCVYNPKTKTCRLVSLGGRIGKLIQHLRSKRSGDILAVLSPGLYFDNPEEYPGNHGGIASSDRKIPIAVAGPETEVQPGPDSSQVYNTQIAATVYRFLTGVDLPPGEVETPLPLQSPSPDLQ
jgi:hypothetical protein